MRRQALWAAPAPDISANSGAEGRPFRAAAARRAAPRVAAVKTPAPPLRSPALRTPCLAAPRPLVLLACAGAAPAQAARSRRRRRWTPARCSRSARWASGRRRPAPAAARVEVERRPARPAPAPGAVRAHRALPAGRHARSGAARRVGLRCAQGATPGTSTCRSPSRCSARPGRRRRAAGRHRADAADLRQAEVDLADDAAPAAGRCPSSPSAARSAGRCAPAQAVRQADLAAPVVRRRRHGADGRRGQRLQRQRRGPGADARHRRPAGARAHRKRARRHRRAGGRTRVEVSCELRAPHPVVKRKVARRRPIACHVAARYALHVAMARRAVPSETHAAAGAVRAARGHTRSITMKIGQPASTFTSRPRPRRRPADAPRRRKPPRRRPAAGADASAKVELSRPRRR